MRILILGGRIFLGRHLVEVARTRGHEMTLTATPRSHGQTSNSYNASRNTSINSSSVKTIGLPFILLDGMALATTSARSISDMP